MSFSNHAEDLALKWMFTDSSVTRPTAWYVAMHTDDPGETGANNEVDTDDDADYLRKSTTFTDPSSGTCTNEGAVTWTVDTLSSGYTVRYVSVWDAATTGNCLAIGQLYSEHAMVADGVMSFAIGDLAISLD